MTVLTTPYSGLNLTLGYRTGSSGAFTTIAQLKDDAEFSGFETTSINVPTIANQVMTKVPGRTDNGQFTGSVYLIPGDAGVAELATLGLSRATIAWQVMLPDGTSSTTGTTYTFSAFVQSLKPGNFTGEDAPSLDFTLEISGSVTLVVGS